MNGSWASCMQDRKSNTCEFGGGYNSFQHCNGRGCAALSSQKQNWTSQLCLMLSLLSFSVSFSSIFRQCFLSNCVTSKSEQSVFESQPKQSSAQAILLRKHFGTFGKGSWTKISKTFCCDKVTKTFRSRSHMQELPLRLLSPRSPPSKAIRKSVVLR